MITVSRLIGSRLGALDGNVGRVRDVLFEDDSWRVRWLVVGLGGGGRVLLAPAALPPPAWRGAPLKATLPAAAVRAAPSADTDLPVERRAEGPLAGLFRQVAAGPEEPRPCDPRLQSCREVASYAALAGGDVAGRIRDLLLDKRDWTVAALILSGGRWGLGRGSAVAVGRIRGIHWEDGTVRLWPGDARDRGAIDLPSGRDRPMIHT